MIPVLRVRAPSMKTQTFLLTAVMVAAALAGCADNGTNDDMDANLTATPASTTPTMTPMPGGGNETGDMEEHPMCPPSTVTGAASSTLAVGVQEPPAGSAAGSADHCYHFTGLHNVTAGLVNITFTNGGHEPHVMALFKLDEGKRMQDVFVAMQEAEDAAQPEWMHEWGGVSLLGPGRSASLIQDLPAGHYLVFCWFGGHMTMGMVAEFDAVAGTSTVTAPTPTASLVLTNFAFEWKDELTPGRHVIAIRNNGTQPHEAPLIALQSGANITTFAEAVEDENAQGPPPGMPIGGVNAFPAGKTVYAIVDVAAGPHGLICFVQDPASHKPHVELGMLLDFAVA